MSYAQNIKESIRIWGLKQDVLNAIANNPSATGYGFLTLTIAGIAMGLGYAMQAGFSPLGITGVFSGIFSIFIGFFVGYSVFHFVAKFIMKGTATGVQYFRALSNASIIYWITIIPFISMYLNYLAGVCMIGQNVVILHKVHNLSWLKAILVGLGIIVLVIVFFAALGAFAYFGVLHPAKIMP